MARTDPSPNSRGRNYPCPACGRPRHYRQDCVYCTTLAWMRTKGMPLPVSGDPDREGRDSRTLASQIGMIEVI